MIVDKSYFRGTIYWLLTSFTKVIKNLSNILYSNYITYKKNSGKGKIKFKSKLNFTIFFM